jgi:spermidine synthase
MKNALKSDGIICSQIGTVWSNLDNVKKMLRHCKASFPNVRYGISYVPSYPTGQIGYILGGLNPVCTT